MATSIVVFLTYHTRDAVYFDDGSLSPLGALRHLFQPSQYLVRIVTVIDRGFRDRGGYSRLGRSSRIINREWKRWGMTRE